LLNIALTTYVGSCITFFKLFKLKLNINIIHNVPNRTIKHSEKAFLKISKNKAGIGGYLCQTKGSDPNFAEAYDQQFV